MQTQIVPSDLSTIPSEFCTPSSTEALADKLKSLGVDLIDTSSGGTVSNAKITYGAGILCLDQDGV
ncbi:hypothetical protein ACF3DV_19605 [Chlorogloeopsis fritschii PCC 9212]|uniref:Uncharacterized protein n=1 Tax=Chlorogloeopsis fritschii PCC 6912 TaxID=211165 RepID=A0A3S0ZVG0_CHLFR|nr:hypothetical protein [Chlorogloeopsis fritschii]RUR84512.1 hypothetical protein PCC6912_14070 [Chlorogloeopsis fritschii PCC 6912]